MDEKLGRLEFDGLLPTEGALTSLNAQQGVAKRDPVG